MDWQTAFNVALGIAGSLGGWLIKFQADEMREFRRANSRLEGDLIALAIKLPTDYIQKGDFKKFEEMISDKLDKIFDKLDAKADK